MNISSETQKDFLQNIDRYMGTWYEIGKNKNFMYEKDCSFALAQYSWNPEKKIMNIRNSCLDADKNVKRESLGVARIPDMNDASKLKVKFSGKDAMPFEGDYYLNWTDYERYAIVGGPTGQWVWILSRTPTVSKKDLPFLLNKVKSFGYNPDTISSNLKFFY